MYVDLAPSTQEFKKSRILSSSTHHQRQEAAHLTIHTCLDPPVARWDAMGSLTTENPFTPPPKQTALTVNHQDEVTLWDEAPCPALPNDQVYVRVQAVAVNPSDTKMRGQFATPFAFLGTDYAGTVVAVGDAAKDLGIKVGDRVYGAQNEMCPRTPDQGAFSRYTVTRGRVWAKVPDAWSTEAAASLPAGISTAGLAMKLLGLPLPYTSEAKPDKKTYVFVYGGSTASATIAMQLMVL